jgi:hypothetical protein
MGGINRFRGQRRERCSRHLTARLSAREILGHRDPPRLIARAIWLVPSHKIEPRRSYLTSEKLGKLSSRVGCVIRAISWHSTDSRTKLYESAGGILIWLVALGSTLHRLTMRRWLIWTLFAGVMGFFVGGSFLAALQTPLPTNGAARQTTQTDTSEPILSRPVVILPPTSAPARLTVGVAHNETIRC